MRAWHLALPYGSAIPARPFHVVDDPAFDVPAHNRTLAHDAWLLCLSHARPAEAEVDLFRLFPKRLG